MSIFALASKPPSMLGFHRVLAPTAGVKKALPLCLGTMKFGTTWCFQQFICARPKTNPYHSISEGFHGRVHANNYQQEESDICIEEWMKARVKIMRISVERSLQKLETDYIDLLYVHWCDFISSVDEVMHGLNSLVAVGKVLYLGVSDTPAWIVVKDNDYAHANGLRPFSVYQGKWNAGFRDLERIGESRKEEELEPACNRPSIRDAQDTTYLPQKIEHLKANVEVLTVSLSTEELEEIDNAAPFDVGFPTNFNFRGNYSSDRTAADVFLTRVSTHIVVPPHPLLVQPRQVQSNHHAPATDITDIKRIEVGRINQL
ncbi:sterigmatocystin biosynthesis dehydrogenase stcV [Penicillium macrosclerotiorum]|uniref:sterigmatocystin biosynthesis dehydrogenase stcV n=1 Tax=Penicillium macrosclerotiorum TaxID=303699 RepID=UPI002547DDED|nr:sterigmatocystin biosynthesis dehydrogenase stcV [Penicillium macrosclerotiorum]KAJ5669172.1 sterigmatocystin biosynthesis dehydrogenase stcV [Penicillium macrosclerotiorum]